MPFQPLVFILARSMAQRQGVSDQEANRLGVVGAVLRPPALGLVAAATIARRETPQALPAPPTMLSLSQMTKTVQVPDVLTLTTKKESDHAAHELWKSGLAMFAWGALAPGPGPVKSQRPKPGTLVAKGSVVSVEIDK